MLHRYITRSIRKLRDAFYELILYPVLSAKLMNEKISFYGPTLKNSQQIQNGRKQILKVPDWHLTALLYSPNIYNKQIAAGKWDGM